MALKNSDIQYGSLAKLLHWLIAAGILALLFLGLEQAQLEQGAAKSYLRLIHASLATVVLMLMTARLIWRFLNPTPEHPDGMPVWQRMAASATHWGLYLCVFVQLGAGAMVIASAGRGLPLFGFYSIPLPIEKKSRSARLVGEHSRVHVETSRSTYCATRLRRTVQSLCRQE